MNSKIYCLNELNCGTTLKKNALSLFVIILLVISISSFVNAASTSTSSPSNTGFSDTASNAISIALLNQNPDPALAGNTVDLKVSVANSGSSSADNLIVEVVPSYPFIAVSGKNTMQNAGPLNAFQSGNEYKSLTYTLMVDKNAVAGTYDLTVKYYPEGSENNSASQTISVNVGTTQSVEVIHIDKTVLVPGQQSDMKFKITNVGGAALNNMRFYWTDVGNVVLPVGSDNTQYIKSLDVGESIELDYQVIADTNANAGLYPLNLYLSYTDALTNNVTTFSTIAGVYIGGGTDFDVAYSNSASGTTSFTVANIGSNPATSVSVSIPLQRGWTTSGSNSVIVGNLNKGDYTVASYTLQQRASSSNFTALGNGRRGSGTAGGSASNATQNYPVAGSTDNSGSVVNTNDLVMQIAYTDTMGNRLVVNKTVNVIGASGGNTTGYTNGRTFSRTTTPSYIWYILGVIIILAGAFWFYRRRKIAKLLNLDNKEKSKKK